MNISLFLNAFIYLFASEGLSSEILYLICIPWFLTCVLNYVIGMMFNQAKNLIKKDLVGNFRKSLKFSLINYFILVLINLFVQFFLVSFTDKTKDALNKANT